MKEILIGTTSSGIYYPIRLQFHIFFKQNSKRVPLVEQELLILPEHLSSPPVFSEVCVTRSLVLCVYFVDRCFCTFFFWSLFCMFFFVLLMFF
jgi:hypothetical protein